MPAPESQFEYVRSFKQAGQGCTYEAACETGLDGCFQKVRSLLEGQRTNPRRVHILRVSKTLVPKSMPDMALQYMDPLGNGPPIGGSSQMGLMEPWLGVKSLVEPHTPRPTSHKLPATRQRPKNIGPATGPGGLLRQGL